MTRTFLFALALAPLVLAASAQAQTVVPPVSTVPGVTPHPAKSGNIIEMRQKALTKIQEKMSRLQSEQSCVSTAQDVNALRACREQTMAHEKKC
jgi:hypothetical protein